MTTATDIELLDSWRSGDTRAGNELVTRHFPRVRTYFANKLPSDHEDLMQETFVRLVRARDQYRGEASFKTYLFRIARHVLAEHLRKRYRSRAVELSTDSIADLTQHRPSSVIAAREAHRLLLDALRQIPLDDQDLLELYYWQDLTAREVGSLFELLESTVRSRIRAALDRLARAYMALSSAPHGREVELGEIERWLGELRAVLVHGRLKGA